MTSSSGSSSPAFRDLLLGMPEPRFQLAALHDVRVPMRDGAQLAADLHLPADPERERFGTVLVRTGYDRCEWRPEGKHAHETRLFAEQGFAVLVQDVYGKFASEGEYHIYERDREDGYDTVQWITEQPWSNGRVATYGCSYLGEVQFLLAASRHPAHVAMIPQTGAMAMNWFGARTGGTLDLVEAIAWFSGDGTRHLSGREPRVDVEQAVWTLPVVEAISAFDGPESDYEEFVVREPNDPWWSEVIHQITLEDRFDVPTLYIDSWIDRVNDTLALMEHARTTSLSERARRNQFAVISTCEHCENHEATEATRFGDANLGDARFPFYSLYVAWLRHWLDDPDPGDFEWPTYTYYVVPGSQWRTSEQWPPPGVAPFELALTSDGRAAEPDSSGELLAGPAPADGVDAYDYDPSNPCPSHGGVSYYPGMKLGMVDQRVLFERTDVATYLGPALDAPLELVGAPELEVFLSSSAPDTDLVVKLLDVRPDGQCWNVCQAILRVRYRDGLTKPARLLEPGVVEPVRVLLGSMCYRFGAGHRVGLLVTSSDFPAYSRNLNVAGAPGLAAEPAIARNSIHHGPSHPSRLILPVLRPGAAS